jgi:serine/threonine protein kinase/tetratricopeptide (TPR) repeat protein
MLGPFELFAMVGKGGMGEVWRGIHHASQAPVAVKVIAQDRSLDEDFIHAFVQEVHAVAALNHPGIIRVFDHGLIPTSTAQQSQGRLVAASPWLGMEFAPCGSLDAAPRLTSWPQLRTLLLSVLAALAHAHARGIVHRDLKPGNILIGETSHGGPRYMLTDFGLAHATHHIIESGSYQERASSAGTPHYMPPEQLAGQWRSYGPWTDLYALGCLAYELCCGMPPFDGASFIHIANEHINTPPPQLKPRFEVPAEFEAWVHTLMAKHIGQRPTRAAQASHMLKRLDETTTISATPSHAPQVGSSSSIFFAPTVAPEESSPIQNADAATLLMTHTLQPRTMGTLLAQDVSRLTLDKDSPFPGTWQPPHDDNHHDLMLAGAGLGLFGLREVPFVDRVPSRQAIWETLREVYEELESRCVLIQGPVGSGKSRLCEWMGRRAHETGVATPLHITHHAQSAADDGLLPSIERMLCCQELDRERTFKRLRLIFEAFAYTDEEKQASFDEAALLTTLLRSHASTSEETSKAQLPHIQIHGRKERQRAILAALKYMTGPRPLILWMDDPHLSEESVEMARCILDHELPILLLLTTPEDAPQLAQIAAHARTSRIVIEPLHARDHHAFVTSQLGLHPQLANHIAYHTHGNPLFAQHLLSDWIARDVLVGEPTGFTHISGNRPEVPDSLDMLWRSKLDHLEQLEAATWHGPLYVAAALGPYFPQSTWLELCEQLDVPCSMNLQQALLTRGLLRYASQDKERLRWGHGALHTRILSDAYHHGPWQRIHHTIAQALAQPRQTLTQRQLYTHHMLCAGDYDQALQEIATTAQQAQDQSDYTLAMELITHHERLCAWMNLPADDARHLELIPLRITTHRVRGELTQALEVAHESLPLLDTSSRKRALLRADVLRTITMIHYLRGTYDISEEMGAEAIHIYETYAHYHGLLKALHTQGWLCMRMGRIAEAMRMFERGNQIGELHNDLIDRAWCLQAIADLHVQRQSPADAEPVVELALKLFEQGGSRAGLAMALCSRGDVLMLRGERAQAAHHYQIADEILTTLQINLRFVSHGRLALLALIDERIEDATDKLKDILSIQGANHQLSIGTHLLQSMLAIYTRDYDVVERHLRLAHDILQFASYAYSDLTLLMERGERMLKDQGAPRSLVTAFRNIRRRLHADQRAVMEALSITSM